eukprot:5775196-Pleurochrysis_carterae.AAC.2
MATLADGAILMISTSCGNARTHRFTRALRWRHPVFYTPLNRRIIPAHNAQKSTHVLVWRARCYAYGEVAGTTGSRGAFGVLGKWMFGVGILTSFASSKQRIRGPSPRLKNQPCCSSGGSPCGPMMWWRRKSTSLYLPSRQHGPRESVKIKKCLEPLVAAHASDRARRRCRHCCCTMAGPPAYCLAKSTTIEAEAERQSDV